jgi:hypothetical protein
MTAKRQAMLAALLAAAALAALGGAALWKSARPVVDGRGAATDLAAVAPRSAPVAAAGASPVAASPGPGTPRSEPERPIEEILAESGEDPGAVKYMSRIRECLRGGNRAFALELLRQMREAHAGSVLLAAAVDLCERGN